MLTFFKSRKQFFYNFINVVPKRIRILFSTLLMTFLILVSTFFNFDNWIFWVPTFIFFSYFLTYISILEDIDGVEWFMLFVMPVFFTIAVYLFYFLLPVRWLTRLPLMFFYAFSFYAMLLTSNIFNVGVEKSIQLYRAAFSVNYLFQSLIVFLAMQVTLSFKTNFAINALATLILTFPFVTQLCWTVRPTSNYEKSFVKYSFLVSLIIIQIAVIMSFIPIRASIQALVITASYYSISGLIYHYVDQRLFKHIVREYVFVLGFVFIIALLTLQ